MDYIVLNDNDKLVVTTKSYLDDLQEADLQDKLDDFFPDHAVLILHSGAKLDVISKE